MADQGISRGMPLKIGIAVAALALAVFLILRQQAGSVSAQPMQWAYDLDSGSLYTVGVTQLPPFDTATGPGRGVAAMVFSCGDCATESRTLYLQTYTERARLLLGDPGAKRMPGEELAGTLIALPPAKGQQPSWLNGDSAQASQIQGQAMTACNGRPAKTCQPGR